MDSLCVWGISGWGAGSHQELEWPDPLHCFQSNGCWVRSLHIHPSCQLLVCVETARPPVYSPSKLVPPGRDVWGMMAKLSLMLLPQNDFPTGHSPVKLTSVGQSVKARFPLQPPGANSALVVSFQTTPSPFLCSGFPFSPRWVSPPFTVHLFCLLCSMWEESDASKLVKPDSEAHTAQCLHRKLCAENPLWLSCTDTYITVCIFCCPLSQVTKTLNKCVRFILMVILFTCTCIDTNTTHTHTHTHVYSHAFIYGHKCINHFTVNITSAALSLTRDWSGIQTCTLWPLSLSHTE